MESTMATSEQTREDFDFSYTDLLNRRATHRVRIFAGASWTTILVTDLTEKHACPSVTNSVEELINALLRERPEIRRERTVVIEHYDDRSRGLAGSRPSATWAASDTFDLVSFSVDSQGRVCEPDWRRITKVEAEQWVGARLP
jgi:hypothetical protein